MLRPGRCVGSVFEFVMAVKGTCAFDAESMQVCLIPVGARAIRAHCFGGKELGPVKPQRTETLGIAQEQEGARRCVWNLGLRNGDGAYSFLMRNPGLRRSA